MTALLDGLRARITDAKLTAHAVRDDALLAHDEQHTSFDLDEWLPLMDAIDTFSQELHAIAVDAAAHFSALHSGQQPSESPESRDATAGEQARAYARAARTHDALRALSALQVTLAEQAEFVPTLLTPAEPSVAPDPTAET